LRSGGRPDAVARGEPLRISGAVVRAVVDDDDRRRSRLASTARDDLAQRGGLVVAGMTTEAGRSAVGSAMALDYTLNRAAGGGQAGQPLLQAARRLRQLAMRPGG
jgi:hypothetical protein